MDDVGAQVAARVFIHQNLPPMARKRNLYYHQAMNLQPQPSQLPPRRDDWNPKSWNWDSSRFVAKPIDTETLRAHDTTALGLRNKGPETDGDEKRLELNLGGGLNSGEEIPALRPGKRVRSGSPGCGNNYPMCQVDNCKEDLSSAKDYHRRHKVCEFHSKATKAPVGNQMQRFCQQCSRFHPLSEFDEGKRSCRRRLAGHNRRRRKTQPDDVTSQILVPGSHGSGHNGNMDLVALLTALACSQAGKNDVKINASSVPDRDQLLQILGKINSLPLPMDLASKLQKIEALTSKHPECSLVSHQNDLDGTSPSTMDLLAALSTTLAASAPNCLAMLSQRSSENYDSTKTNLASSDRQTTGNLEKTPHEFGLVGGERSSSSHQSPSQDSDYHVQDARSSLSLQLFTSSPENESRPTVASSRNYFSSDSSKSVEGRSQSSSPVMQELFPLQNSPETVRSRKMSSDRTGNVEAVGSKRSCLPLELFNVSNRVAEKTKFQSFPYRSGYTSSGSDHSPPSLNSDVQDRTGRIHFKLFGKEPSQLPSTMRSELFDWLSNCPSGMESHIRPGCVVLSVYVSMPVSDWEQIEGYLVQRLNYLLQGSASDFWRNARFLVNTGKQLASHKNGKIRLCKSWTTLNSPELISMSPIAIVPGQDTNLVLRGRNLTNDGIKIRCAYMGSYASMIITGTSFRGTVYDEIKLNSFQIPGTSSGILGRCFIEVENGFRGNFFPLIIADSTICLELKHLEDEIQEPHSKECDDIIEEQKKEGSHRPRSREDILHFLNELGWLFQMKNSSSVPEGGSKFSLIRFKFLLVFSIERDFSALVRTLLDMMVEGNSDSDGVLSKVSLDMLVEIQLLNRAVKRRCTKMVEMLIHYSTNATTESRKFVFPPNLAGPGGITPLHLAACTLGSDDMIDILTNDPQEIGLSSWNSLLDAAGQSPYCYAAMRNNHSYNILVARKLVDRKNGQLSLTVKEPGFTRLGSGLKRSCASCSATAIKYHKRVSGSHRLFPTPIIHSMLAVATVCVCVCLFMHAFPNVRQGSHFSWQGLDFGSM